MLRPTHLCSWSPPPTFSHAPPHPPLLMVRLIHFCSWSAQPTSAHFPTEPTLLMVCPTYLWSWSTPPTSAHGSTHRQIFDYNNCHFKSNIPETIKSHLTVHVLEPKERLKLKSQSKKYKEAMYKSKNWRDMYDNIGNPLFDSSDSDTSVSSGCEE